MNSDEELDVDKRRVGRPKMNPTWKYCELQTQEDGSKFLRCSIQGCKESIKGDNISNFERHVMRNHGDEFTAITMEKEALKSTVRRGGPPAKKRRTLLNGVHMSMEELSDACVSIVAESGRPFAIIDDPGFQRILRPILDAMPGDEKSSISSFTVRRLVYAKADDIDQNLREELANKMLSLKVDTASRRHRNFLAINVQFIKNGRITLRTLACKELKERATSRDLQRITQDVLWEYNIPVRNLYSFTTDNGANMILAGQLLQDVAAEEAENEDAPNTDESSNLLSTTTSELSTSTNDEEEEDSISNVDSEEEKEDFDEEQNPEQENEDDPLSSSTLEDGDLQLPCVRCAPHSLQLAVADTIESKRIRPLLSSMRNLARALRTKNSALMLGNMNLKMPILDCETRWHSTHDMLESLIPLRDFCGQFSTANKLPKISKSRWKQVDKLVEALQPAKVATKTFQEEQLVMGDFYGAWLKCKMNTKSIKTPIATQLVKNMERREKKLLENDAFAAAIYLDPRYFSLLTPEACSRAEVHLVKLWARLEEMRVSGSGRPEDSSETITAEAGDTRDADELEELLAAGDVGRIATSGGASRTNILPELKWFRAQPRLRPVSANVLKYWEEKRFEQPELYALASVALAVPAAQVSVERLFSGMRFVLSDLRFSLSGEALDKVMKIRQYGLSERRVRKMHHVSSNLSSTPVSAHEEMATERQHRRRSMSSGEGDADMDTVSAASSPSPSSSANINRSHLLATVMGRNRVSRSPSLSGPSSPATVVNSSSNSPCSSSQASETV